MDDEKNTHGGVYGENKFVNKCKRKNWRYDFEFSDADLDPDWEDD